MACSRPATATSTRSRPAHEEADRHSRGLLLVAALVAATASGEGDDGGDYKVRAYFDNAGFLVNGEEVRIAGATVGTVDEVTVSLPGEPVRRNGDEEPGKAVAVLSINDSGFQDFLTDASCLIRPQSLLGEKYVECEPTQPRAPETQPPPALEQIPDGEIGAGQYCLPIENNGKQIDLDLVNNITRQPEVERFRLILNDLGAGLAARGPDLAEVIRRADPALQQTDKVLATLAKQNQQLAQLAQDSDTILQPLSEQRQHLAGFIRNAATAGTAAAERRDDIVAGFDEFPNALRELQSTMVELRRFAEQATPVAVGPPEGGAGPDRRDEGAAAVLEGRDDLADEPRGHDRGQRRRPRRLLSGHPSAPQGRREVDPGGRTSISC